MSCCASVLAVQIPAVSPTSEGGLVMGVGVVCMVLPWGFGVGFLHAEAWK